MFWHRFYRTAIRATRGLQSILVTLGIAVAVVLLLTLGLWLLRPDWQTRLSDRLVPLLQWRINGASPPAPSQDLPVRAIPLAELAATHHKAVLYLANKYRIAPEAIAAMMQTALALGKETGLDPYLIMAVAAIESNFHPYVQSRQGAQGLMQVITKIHAKRFERYGGVAATFDPIVNLRVGTYVLRDCIKLKDGKLEEGLRFYLGGDNITDNNEGGYVRKVQAEQEAMHKAVVD